MDGDVVSPNNSKGAKFVAPIGFLTPNNINRYFFPTGWSYGTNKSYDNSG